MTPFADRGGVIFCFFAYPDRIGFALMKAFCLSFERLFANLHLHSCIAASAIVAMQRWRYHLRNNGVFSTSSLKTPPQVRRHPTSSRDAASFLAPRSTLTARIGTRQTFVDHDLGDIAPIKCEPRQVASIIVLARQVHQFSSGGPVDQMA